MLEIVEYPHPFLRYKCKPLKKVDESIKQIVNEMINTLHEEKGAGLSAPQVQLPFRVIVLTHDGDEYAFINPVIERATKAKYKTGPEGCLSLTDLVLPIRRPDKIRFKGWTLDGDDVDEIVTGPLARILQHEVDHLDGVLIIDKIGYSLDLQKRVAPYLRMCEQAFEDSDTTVNWDLVDELVEQYC